MDLEQQNKILMKALKLAVKDVNELTNKLNKGMYIPYTSFDYIESAQKMGKDEINK